MGLIVNIAGIVGAGLLSLSSITFPIHALQEGSMPLGWLLRTCSQSRPLQWKTRSHFSRIQVWVRVVRTVLS